MPKLNSYLGVDLGSGGIKIVELANQKGVPQLVTYGYSQSPLDQLKSINNQDLKTLGALLKHVADKAKVSTYKCVTALPTFSVFSSIVTLTDVAKNDIPNAIRLEAKKVVPLPLEQMILDSQVIAEDMPGVLPSGQSAPETLGSPITGAATNSDIAVKTVKTTRVLLTAAPKDLVARYVEVFKTGGFQLMRLETEAFALTRSLLGNDKSVAMIIDFGASNTNISVIDKNIPILNRGVDLGGNALTKIISQTLKLSLPQADQFKKDWRRMLTGPDDLPEIIKNGLAPLVNEVKYIFNFYQTQSRYIGLSSGSSERIEKIILTGGASGIPFIDTLLSKLLNVKVFLGDPWASVSYPLDLKEVLGELGPTMSVSVGLALGKLNE